MPGDSTQNSIQQTDDVPVTSLDPQEVFDELPVRMREAFQSREVSRLQDLADKMDEEVFNYHFQRCIKAGLWIPDASPEEKSGCDQQSTLRTMSGDATQNRSQQTNDVHATSLDPQEVVDELPVRMREAFQSQEVSRLQDLQDKWTKRSSITTFRCIKVGLWIPDASPEEKSSCDQQSTSTDLSSA